MVYTTSGYLSLGFTEILQLNYKSNWTSIPEVLDLNSQAILPTVEYFCLIR